MAISYAGLVSIARELEGRVLTTAGGRATFRVEVQKGRNREVIVVTPTSTGSPRRLGATTEKVLAVFNKTGSMNPSDYQRMEFHTSYVFALIEAIRNGPGV